MTFDLSKLRIVLVGTTHPGNIGAAARAMKAMGLDRLYLVEPKIFPHAEVTARAAGADDLLEKAVVIDTLEEALEGCGMVVGASARLRTLPVEVLTPREMATKVLQESSQHEVAILFGQERSGLSNDELLRCNYHVHIPTAPDFSALNLAAAVQVIAYEIKLASEASPKKFAAGEPLATADELEYFHEHLEKTLLDVNFLNDDDAHRKMQRLRRLFTRIRLEKAEIKMLRGILSSVQRKS